MEKEGTVGIFVDGVIWGEMLSNISFGERAKDGIAKGVEQYIGIGMSEGGFFPMAYLWHQSAAYFRVLGDGGHSRFLFEKADFWA